MSRPSASLPALPYPSWVEVAGFKSIKDPARIDIRPLTLLAGANSSGKSSIFQTLLLLKQSMEAISDPDPLLLDGPHVVFTSLDQLLSRGRSKDNYSKEFSITFGTMTVLFAKPEENLANIKLTFTRTSSKSERLIFKTFARNDCVSDWIEVSEESKADLLNLLKISDPDAELNIYQKRLFASIWGRHGEHKQNNSSWHLGGPLEWVRSIFHLPGHRGHRERKYPITKVTKDRSGDVLVNGPMPPYAASLLLDWHRLAKDNQASDSDKKIAQQNIAQVDKWLLSLGLTWKVISEQFNAAELELRVGRLSTPQRGETRDLVDIADVGFGVSQVLPVLVALAAAAPGQMVLIEQPELHLHPRAQLAMGGVLADAAKRGVIVVVETHSQLILRAIQTVVAKKKLAPEQVGLHWCARDNKTGWSTVTQADLQQDGSFGDWPVDFPDVFSMADQEFIDAVFGDGEQK